MAIQVEQLSELEVLSSGERAYPFGKVYINRFRPNMRREEYSDRNCLLHKNYRFTLSLFVPEKALKN